MIDLFGKDDTVLTKSRSTSVNRDMNMCLSGLTGVPIIVGEIAVVVSCLVSILVLKMVSLRSRTCV